MIENKRLRLFTIMPPSAETTVDDLDPCLTSRLLATVWLVFADVSNRYLSQAIEVVGRGFKGSFVICLIDVMLVAWYNNVYCALAIAEYPNGFDHSLPIDLIHFISLESAGHCLIFLEWHNYTSTVFILFLLVVFKRASLDVNLAFLVWQ
jgi:hypothetical protein